MEYILQHWEVNIVFSAVKCRWCLKQWCEIEFQYSNSKCVSRNNTHVEDIYQKWSIASLYKRISKEKRKGNWPMPNNLSLYTVRLPTSNQSLRYNIPCKTSLIMSHSTNWMLSNTTTSHQPKSQHLRPLLNYAIYTHHHFRIFSCHFNLSPCPSTLSTLPLPTSHSSFIFNCCSHTSAMAVFPP